MLRVLLCLAVLALGVHAYSESDEFILNPSNSDVSTATGKFVWSPNDGGVGYSWPLTLTPDAAGAAGDASLNARTVSFWINMHTITATPGSVFFKNEPGSAINAYRRPSVFTSNAVFETVAISSIQGDGNYYSGSYYATPQNTWTHYAVVHANGDFRVYIDGNTNFTDTPTAPLTSAEPLLTKYTGAHAAQNSAYETADASIYDLRWFNTSLSQAEVQALFALGGPPVAAPTITTHPQSQTVGEGATVVLTCAASGYASFKWQKGGVDLSDGGIVSGSDTDTLELAGVSNGVDDTGDYTCIATNDIGSTTSNAATLTIDVCTVDTINTLTDNAVTIDEDNSGMVNNQLKMVVKESAKYSSSQFLFDGNCGTHWTWTPDFPTISGGCVRTWTGYIDWTNAYDTASPNDCDFVRTVDGTTNEIVFTSDFRVVNVESLDPVRGVSYTRTVTHKLPFELRFPATVDVNLTSEIEVFAPLVVAGTQNEGLQVALTEQIVNPGAEPTMALKFVTSVQHPFILQNPSFSLQPALLAGAVGEDTGNGLISCPDTASTEGSVTSCVGVWDALLTPESPRCNFNGTYEITFDVVCQPSRSTSCPLDSQTDNITVEFTLRTSEHCGVVTDTIALTATMYSYADAGHTTQKDNFLDGQTIYFVTETVSDQASLATTEYESVKVTPSGDTQKTLYDSTSGISADGTSLAFATTADSTTRAAGEASKPSFQFDVDSTYFGAPADGSNTVTVDVVVAATYANAGQKRLHYQYVVQDDPTSGSTSARATIAAATVPGSSNGATTSSASTAGYMSTGFSQMTVMTVCGGLIVFIGLVSLYVMHAIRVPADLKELQAAQTSAQGEADVELTKSSSQVQLTTSGESSERL